MGLQKEDWFRLQCWKEQGKVGCERIFLAKPTKIWLDGKENLFAYTICYSLWCGYENP